MSEVIDRQKSLEAILASMGTLMELEGPDVPAWAAHELTFGQVRLLFLLSKNGATPMSGIAEWLGVGLPTASGAVERLERHGLVERQHRLDDRRVVDCQLTDAGRTLIDEIAGFRLEMMRRILGVLDAEEMAQLERLVNLLVERTQAAMNKPAAPEVSDNEGRTNNI